MIICDQKYWDNLEIRLENKRIEKSKELEKYWNSDEGKIKKAYINFCMWCRCYGKDPTKDTYELLKKYLDESNDATYKGEDRILFQPQTKNYIENKKMLQQIIININKE